MAATGDGFERYLNVRSAWGASFSPDGNRLAFLSDITGVAEVWCVPVAPGEQYPAWPDQLTFRGERAQSATFAANRETLLLAGDSGGTENTQLFLVNADGAGFTDLTGHPDVIYQFGGWSPDGARICFACNARDRRYFDVYEREVAGDGSEPRLLLQADATNYAARYAPDGAAVLVERHDSNVRTTLILVDRATGAARTLTPEAGDAHAQYASAAWSASRDSLYLLSDRGRDFMALASLDLATLELTYLRDDPWDAEALAVSADGARLALVLNEDGYSRLELFDVSGGWDARRPLPAPDLPWRGELREPVWSPDGRRLAFTLDAPDANPDVWVWDVDAHMLQRATRSARGGLAPDALVAPSLVHFPTFDGRQIPAFLFLPRGAEPKRLPTVLYVHGGPESQFRPMFHPIVQYFVNEGYAVLAPNVRGSSGYGYTYQSLDDIRLRMDSVHDLKYAAAWLAESGIADARRIAIWGRSYGGFMVLAAVTTYPDIWAAGVDIVGIANFVTFLENTGPWRRRLRESEYGSLENDRDFLEDISPIHKVDRITAPMFVIHGANDPRVPVGEAEQIVAALGARGVPVEYLRFEDEGHQFAKRSTNLATYPAVARFLDRHVRGG